MVIGGYSDDEMTKCIRDVELYSLSNSHVRVPLKAPGLNDKDCLQNIFGAIMRVGPNTWAPVACDSTRIGQRPSKRKPCFIYHYGEWKEADYEFPAGTGPFLAQSFAKIDNYSLWVIGDTESYLLSIDEKTFEGKFSPFAKQSLDKKGGHNCIALLRESKRVLGIQGAPGNRVFIADFARANATIDHWENTSGIENATWCEVAYGTVNGTQLGQFIAPVGLQNPAISRATFDPKAKIDENALNWDLVRSLGNRSFAARGTTAYHDTLLLVGHEDHTYKYYAGNKSWITIHKGPTKDHFNPLVLFLDKDYNLP